MDIKNYFPFRECRYDISEGLVTLLVKNPKPSFFDKYFFKKNLEMDLKVELDEIGSYVWSLCDGHNTVDQIIQTSHERFKEKIDPVEDRVVKFINKLAEHKFISLYEKR